MADADTTISYRKIRGSSSGAFESTRLYAGPDHLLQVTSSGYRESYRRFYFRDIQSITVRQSRAGKVISGILGGLLLLCLVVGLQVSGPGLAVWSVPAAMLLLLLMVNIMRGPTCVCQIRTAVQTRQLGSLKRLRQAGRFLAQLRPQIEAAQEPLAPEEILRRLEQIRQGGFYNREETETVAPSSPSETAPGFQ